MGVCFSLDAQHSSDFVADDLWIQRVLETTLSAIPTHYEQYEMGIALVDEPYSRQLNHLYRGKDKPTNVLSFYSDTPDELAAVLEAYPLGDLVICLPVVMAEAQTQAKSVHDHFSHLIVHGLLHLCGYDHETSEADCAQMEALEIAILGELGIKNPYLC